MTWADKFWFAGLLWGLMGFYCSVHHKWGPTTVACVMSSVMFILGPFA